jgi:integrase/recombinase XerD
MPFTAARALSCALAALGYAVPTWSASRPEVRPTPLVERYLQHRLQYRGIARRTHRFESQCATTLLGFLTACGRTVRTIRIVDIDAFVISRSKMFTAKTVAGICSALRAFLRYLHMVGLTAVDLAAHVASPRVRSVDRPPRAVPWNTVRRILHAIDTTSPLGLRDKALFLMMATYGMGAAEVIGLRLDDIDWRARRLRLRRPKTGVVTELPLLDPVGHALAAYLRQTRPAHASTRAVFVSAHLPHEPLSGSTTIRHRLALYAERAGVREGYLGTHLFRHSHATRQIEQGQPAKVVGDILGHRRPESTSVYTRSAVLRLRAMALPVPR